MNKDCMWYFFHLPRSKSIIVEYFLFKKQVFYRVAMAIVLLFYKHSSSSSSEWMNEISKNGIDSAISKFCRQIPVSSWRVKIQRSPIFSFWKFIYFFLIFRWHQRNSCALLLEFVDLARRIYQRSSCERKWPWRAEV